MFWWNSFSIKLKKILFIAVSCITILSTLAWTLAFLEYDFLIPQYHIVGLLILFIYLMPVNNVEWLIAYFAIGLIGILVPVYSIYWVTYIGLKSLSPVIFSYADLIYQLLYAHWYDAVALASVVFIYDFCLRALSLIKPVEEHTNRIAEENGWRYIRSYFKWFYIRRYLNRLIITVSLLLISAFIAWVQFQFAFAVFLYFEIPFNFTGADFLIWIEDDINPRYWIHEIIGVHVNFILKCIMVWVKTDGTMQFLQLCFITTSVTLFSKSVISGFSLARSLAIFILIVIAPQADLNLGLWVIGSFAVYIFVAFELVNFINFFCRLLARFCGYIFRIVLKCLGCFIDQLLGKTGGLYKNFAPDSKVELYAFTFWVAGILFIVIAFGVPYWYQHLILMTTGLRHFALLETSFSLMCILYIGAELGGVKHPITLWKIFLLNFAFLIKILLIAGI